MTRIYFVRHAEPNYSNHNDIFRELSPRGMVDRELVTDFLADKHIDIVISSPFKRAIDTIVPFAEEKGLEIEMAQSLFLWDAGRGIKQMN